MKSISALICAFAVSTCSFCDKDEDDDYVPTNVPMASGGARSSKVMKKEGEYDLAVIGDSTTAGWERFPECEPENYANLGVGGENIQGALWRVRNGQFDNLKAKTIILNVGTNNFISNPIADIANGVANLKREVQKRNPDSVVKVMAPFPAPMFFHQSQALERSLSNMEGFISINDQITSKESTDGLHWGASVYCKWSEEINES